jgi:RNA polymerase sigma-70 factor (ECF subfamily)
VTDAELLRLIQTGDGAALGTLYERCLPSVWRYVYARVGSNQHAAEDIVGETFLAAVQSVATFIPEAGTPLGWLIGIARHKLADHMRSGAHFAGAIPTDVVSGISTFDALDARDQVLVVLDQMPEEERQVLEWKYLEELSVAVIAERLGRTEKAVEALLYRARNAFRELHKREVHSNK